MNAKQGLSVGNLKNLIETIKYSNKIKFCESVFNLKSFRRKKNVKKPNVPKSLFVLGKIYPIFQTTHGQYL